MICKYSGPCERCGLEIPKGAECGWNPETRKIFHLHDCTEAQVTAEDQAALAERLGFVDWEEAERTNWKEISEIAR